MIPTVIYDYDPRNLPQDILAAIGLVASASAQTESIVEMGIGGCASLRPDYSHAFTTHMNAPLRDNVLRACAEIKLDDLDALDELDEILDEIKECFKKRNGYLHRTWCRHPATGQCFIVRIEARGSVDSELIPITVDEVKADALRIYEAGMALMVFLKLNGLLSPIPNNIPPRAHKTKAARKKRREALLRGEKTGK